MRRLALLALVPLALAACRPASDSSVADVEETPVGLTSATPEELQADAMAFYRASVEPYEQRGDALSPDSLANAGGAYLFGVPSYSGSDAAPVVPRDTATALRILRLAADRGSAEAKRYLYLHAVMTGDSTRAMPLLHEAARRGSREAMHEALSQDLLHGRGDSVRALARGLKAEAAFRSVADSLLGVLDANASNGVTEARAMADTLRAALAPSR